MLLPSTPLGLPFLAPQSSTTAHPLNSHSTKDACPVICCRDGGRPREGLLPALKFPIARQRVLQALLIWWSLPNETRVLFLSLSFCSWLGTLSLNLVLAFGPLGDAPVFVQGQTSSPKREFSRRISADIRGSFVWISRVKTSVRALEILEKSKHLLKKSMAEGADVHNSRDSQKLRSEKLWAEISLTVFFGTMNIRQTKGVTERGYLHVSEVHCLSALPDWQHLLRKCDFPPLVK